MSEALDVQSALTGEFYLGQRVRGTASFMYGRCGRISRFDRELASGRTTWWVVFDVDAPNEHWVVDNEIAAVEDDS